MAEDRETRQQRISDENQAASDKYMSDTARDRDIAEWERRRREQEFGAQQSSEEVTPQDPLEKAMSSLKRLPEIPDWYKGECNRIYQLPLRKRDKVERLLKIVIDGLKAELDTLKLELRTSPNLAPTMWSPGRGYEIEKNIQRVELDIVLYERELRLLPAEAVLHSRA